jgi:hypothetical protein
MPIWPPSPYVQPGIHARAGNLVPTSWSLGSGPLPLWADDEVKDWCMANIGRMRSHRMTRWVHRYFKRKDEIMRKRAKANGLRPVSLDDVQIDVKNGVVMIRWHDTTKREVVMLKEFLVPCTLALVAVHDC